MSDDQVTSQKIKEADGTTGQNTNTGSGVKTGHIQDGAVTDAKISGVISGTKIGTHTHSQSQVTGLEAALAGKSDVTHNHDVLYQQKYGKVAVVAQTGGDYADPITAMNNISSWCGIPSAVNPCLLKIMPGVYNIGSTALQMQSYIDIEGSGENNTKLTSTVGGSYTGAVIGASNATLRTLSVEGLGGAAIFGLSLSNFKIENIRASAMNGWANIGIWILGGSDIVIKNVSSFATGGNESYAIFADSANVVLDSVIATAQGDPYYTYYGFVNNYATVEINNSKIFGSRNSIFELGGTIYVSNTKLTGPIDRRSGTLKCVGVFNENYDMFTCP